MIMDHSSFFYLKIINYFIFITSFNMHHQKPLIGVKGRIETRNVEKDEKVTHITELIAEKITFLSSGKNKQEAEE